MVLLASLVMLAITLIFGEKHRASAQPLDAVRSYLPIVTDISKPVFGLAYPTWRKDDVRFDSWLHADALDLTEDYPWHNWSIHGTEHGQFTTFVFSPLHVREFCDSGQSRGLVIVGNECDLQEQCDDTPPADVIAMFHDVISCCPDCQIVGPAFSAADDGSLSLAFYRDFVASGGDPDKLLPSIHLYPYALDDASTRVDEFVANYLVPTNQQHKEIFVTEVGWQTCFPLDTFADWLADLAVDSRIEKAFLYTPRTSDGPCGFSVLVDSLGRLTATGEVVRDVLTQEGHY
jgi:hypothetical protein